MIQLIPVQRRKHSGDAGQFPAVSIERENWPAIVISLNETTHAHCPDVMVFLIRVIALRSIALTDVA